MEKFGRIAIRTTLWIIGSILFLVLLIVILIQVPSVQNYLKDKTVAYLQNKIHTKVQIGHISLGLPKLLVLEDVYFEDQHHDTLVAGEKLKVDISMLKLLHHQVEINEINLQGITAKVHRGADSVFNFDYIIKAFASAPQKSVQPADTSAPMKFSVDKIILDKINISYQDVISGNDVKFTLGHFDTRIKDFDMDKMKFTIPKITLSDVHARFVQTPVIIHTDTATTPFNMALKLGEIDLSRIDVGYKSPDMLTQINLGKLFVEMDGVDLKRQIIGIKNFELTDTRAAITLNAPENVKQEIKKVIKKADTLLSASNGTKPWAVKLAKLNLADNDIKFDNNAQKPIARGLDYGHIDIKNLNAGLRNFAYNADTISGEITELNFADKSGLTIKKLHTNFFYGPKNASLNNLYLETPQTVLQKQVNVSYPSIAAISKNIGLLNINANLDGSVLSLKDVLLLMPDMATMEPFKHSPNSVFKIDGHVSGQVNYLRIPSVEISGLSNTHIKGSAVLKGLPDMNKAFFDLNIADFNTNASDLAKVIPAGTIPSSVSIPQSLNLKGTFKGGIKNFDTRLSLRSSDGAVDLDGQMRRGAVKGAESYSANIKANDLNVGKLIKQPQNVGNISLTAHIKGTGLDPKTASLQFNGNVSRADIKGYSYQNLAMKGSASKGSYVLNAHITDPNISLNLDAKADLNKKYPAINTTLMVDSINLQKLHFTKDDVRFHGKLTADLPTADPDYLNGHMLLTEVILVDKGQRIKLDTVSLISTATADSSTLLLKAPLLTAHLSGKYKLTEVGTALQDALSKYYNTDLAKTPETARPVYSPQQFTFNLRLVKTAITANFLPDLKKLDPVLINGHFNSQTGDLVVNGTIPKVVYGTQTINNAKLDIHTANNALNYNITADEIKASSSLDLLYTSLSGKAQNNKLDLSLQVRDAAKKERYRLAGVFSVLPDEYQFSFLQNGLLLDYAAWTVAADNSLQFGGKGLSAHNFAISNGGQSLSVNSNTPQMNAPVTVSFKNFKIETLTKLAKQDSLLVGGTINGTAVISNFQKSPQFTSALNINDFNFRGDTVGNVALRVNNQTQNAYNANVAITGKGNQVNLDGAYYTDGPGRMDLTLNIATLNMKSIEGFTFGYIRRANGALNGQLKITGPINAPAIRGDVNFNQVGFNVSMLNSYFLMPKESISFNQDGIGFNNFTMVDSTGNKAVVTGTLYTSDYSNYRFGIDINTNNFRVINSTQADNKLYYGKLYLDSRITIRGDMNKPVVDANLTVNDLTDLTIVLPTTDPGVEDRKGVVEFVDHDEPRLDSILLAKQLDSIRHSEVTGLDVSATLKINKNANFNIVIDERNGDVVHLKGEAQLSGAIDPSGKISLTGTYTVNQGSYNLSYATVNKKFVFKPGSTITWTGDPTSANINLTAVYVAKVPPIDLVSDQLSGETQLTMYKQKLPFNVNLSLKNELMKPDISFDIVLPDSTYTVSSDVVNTVNARLSQIRQDPNELNKQVLGVLVLGHFIGDNPLQSQGGSTGVEGIVRNSVSSLLSDQLNKLAGNLIAGVDLNFDLQSGTDYSTGTAQNRTDLNVGLSKQFLNDRLTVTVGNNFNLEGQNQPGQKATNIAGDLSVGYKLSKDGRYLLRAYRKNEYVVIQGEIIETGVAFSLTVDYNRLSEIFGRRSPEEKAMRKKYDADEKAQKEHAKTTAN